MKVMVAGAKGMLGTDLSSALLSAGHEVKALSRAELDISDLQTVMRGIKSYKPDAVINCAAYTNVDACETDIDGAYSANAVGAGNLAIACNEADCALLHISTDYIFDGRTDKPYIEWDAPNPQNVYGKSKLAGENNVKSLTNKYYLVRTQWLFGMNGKNFVKTILSLAEEGKRLTVVNDQSGSPTYTKDLAKAICQLIRIPAYGVYHVTNSGICSWYEFAVRVLEFSGLKTDIAPVSTDDFKRPAKRPAYSPLANFNMKLCGFELLRPFEDALADYLAEYREGSTGV